MDHANRELSPLAQELQEAYWHAGRVERESRLEEKRATLEHQRQQLAALQQQLAGTRKPRWGAKRIAKAVAELTLPVEELYTVWWEQKPIEEIQAHVAAEMARVETTLALPAEQLLAQAVDTCLHDLRPKRPRPRKPTSVG
jgi:hypothetical protein